MLVIKSSAVFTEERQYIYNILLKEFLGLEYIIEYGEYEGIEITLQDDSAMPSKKINICDVFFRNFYDKWLTEDSLPKQPLIKWNHKVIKWFSVNSDDEVCVIYGETGKTNNYIILEPDQINIGIDIFGSTFFMLTRYEEVVRPFRDEHGRFPATGSLAYQEGFLDRPIVDEYVELLWSCMKYLWPGLERKKNQFIIKLSHDVDIPFYFGNMPFSGIIKTCAGDIIKRKSVSLSVKNFFWWNAVKRGTIEKDPYNTFDLIMDISENNNSKSAFYMHSNGGSKFDGNFSFEHSRVKKLIKSIHERGHEIGIHPSYNTYLDPAKIQNEFLHLKEICESIGVEQNIWGGRQHYLRWQVPYTWQYYEDAGIDYDASLSYADYAGFRCGTCREFPVFNLLTRKELSLIERPLLVMDSSLFNKKYMGLDYEEAFEHIKKLVSHCKKYEGNFTLLWHNSELVDKKDVKLYKSIIDFSRGY